MSGVLPAERETSPTGPATAPGITWPVTETGHGPDADHDPLCHTFDPLNPAGRSLCGAPMTGNRPEHSRAACDRLGHAVCVVCQDLWEQLTERGQPPAP